MLTRTLILDVISSQEARFLLLVPELLMDMRPRRDNFLACDTKRQLNVRMNALKNRISIWASGPAIP